MVYTFYWRSHEKMDVDLPKAAFQHSMAAENRILIGKHSMNYVMFLYIIPIVCKIHNDSQFPHKEDKMSKCWCFVLWLNLRKVEIKYHIQH